MTTQKPISKSPISDAFLSKNAEGNYLSNGCFCARCKNITGFPFTGKEKDPETGYSYFGARYLDHELMTTWLSMDPMSDKYPSISPYAYCAWNPLKLVDPEGNELTDFYDITTGKYLKHIEDGKDEAIAIRESVFISLEKENVSTDVIKQCGISLGRNSEFVAIAGTLYAESTPDECSFEEMAAIGSVVRNRAFADEKSIYEVVSTRRYGVYGYRSRGKIDNPKANKHKVNLAFKAAMFTLCTAIDYSNGAYFWQGKDFSIKDSKISRAYELFYETGFIFTSSSHDIYNMGSYSKGGSVPYKYESTAAFSGTVFMRLTTTWKQANGSTQWNGK